MRSPFRFREVADTPVSTVFEASVDNVLLRILHNDPRLELAQLAKALWTLAAQGN